MLVGEPGVGRTAIIREIARLATSRRAEGTLGCLRRLVTLEIASLVADVGGSGWFEHRLFALLEAAGELAPGVALVIEDVHVLADLASRDGGSALVVILERALARGVRLVGTTTPLGHHRMASRMPGIDRVLRPVIVPSLDPAAAVAAVAMAKGRIEEHHGIRVRHSAVEEAVRRCASGPLPGAAIDLIDLAAAMLRLDQEFMPRSLDSSERTIHRLEAERDAVGASGESDREERVAALQSSLERAREVRRELQTRWTEELQELDALRHIRASIDDARASAEAALRRGELEVSARIQYGEIADLSRRLAEVQTARTERERAGRNLMQVDVDETVIRSMTAVASRPDGPGPA